MDPHIEWLILEDLEQEFQHFRVTMLSLLNLEFASIRDAQKLHTKTEANGQIFK